ncbi:MAG TPA: cache domain-containing protein [Vicinamibacterales bacterium]|nr:cache domain-containing protein [Vicinamibacterales bacterium]
MRPQLQAINARVLTVILLVALPVLVIGAAIVISIGQTRLHQTQSAQLAQIAEYTAGAVDAYVFRRILDASLLARVPDIRRTAAAGTAAPFDAARAKETDAKWQADRMGDSTGSPVLANPASEFLADLVKQDSVYREILVTDKHGRLVAASNVTSDYFQADEDWWIRAFDRGRGRVSVTDVRRDESAQVYAFEIAVPVHAPGGDEIAGIMKVVADSRELLAGIAGLDLGAGSEAMLVRPDGSIVFSRRAHREGDKFFAAELLRQRLDEREARREAPGPLTLEAQGDEGGRRIVAIAPSQLNRSFPELPWMIALSSERDELLAPFRSLVWYLIVVFAATALAVVAIALWFSLRLAAPIGEPEYDLHLVDHPELPRMEDGSRT